MTSPLQYRRPRLAANWDRLDAQGLRDLQDQRLRTYVREQLILSPFYESHFKSAGVDPRTFKGLEDLEKIPFCSKKDVIASPENPTRPRDLVLHPTPERLKHWPLSRRLPLLGTALFEGKAVIKRELSLEYRPMTLTFTTGRSSAPTPFFYSLYDMDLSALIGQRLMEVIGVEPEADKAVSLFPYAPHLAFWQTFMVSMGGGMFILNTGGGRIMATPKILDILEKMQPTLIMGIPGYMYHLMRQAEAEGRKFKNVRRVALGGEKVTPLLKVRLKEILKRMGSPDPEVLSILGFTESRQCWAECPDPAGSGFHLYPDTSFIEIIDPDTGKVLGDGQTGEMVYTSLDGRASSLFRYRTGDIIQGGITHTPCPHCGRTVPRIGTDIRRFSNMKDFHLTKVKGTLLDLNILAGVLGNHAGVEEWQLVITKLNGDPLEVDVLTLYIALRSGADEAAVKADLVKQLQHQCEVSPNAIVVENLEALLQRVGMEDKVKEERIVDRR
ncbi:MAG: phenylacetate--CoA ligase family protein [Planctomycetota bacterium]